MISRRLLPVLLATSFLACHARAQSQGIPESAVPALIQRIQGELGGELTDDSKNNPAVPHGETIEGDLPASSAYPGTEHTFRVYVPAQYDPTKPACLLFCFDGIPEHAHDVLDNLIAAREMPVTIAVGISSGVVWRRKPSVANRWNRSYEFDSTNAQFAGFVLDELLPRVETMKTTDGRPIRISRRATDRAATGASTGGIGSFTLAWERPDSFSRVYSRIGTFVSMRGGNDYPAIIRKTDPKPVRIFLEDGSTDAWNPLFGSWFTANENMEAALTFSGYDVQHAWGVHGHDGRPGDVIFPDVMRWLWRGWPAEVKAGESKNDMLSALSRSGEGWKRVEGDYAAASAPAGNAQGEVCFYDSVNHSIDRVSADGKVSVFVSGAPQITGEAFGPNGTLYATVPSSGQIVAFDAKGTLRTVATGLRAGHILVTSAGELIVSEPGEHSDEPSAVWRIGTDGKRTLLDRGLLAASGIAVSPDASLFFAGGRSSSRVTSFVFGPSRSLDDGEPNYWLHADDVPGGAGSGDLAVDTQGSLYAATRLGVQVCDRNGRVRAILWLPTPSGPVEGLAWGGADRGTLFATDRRTVYRRILRTSGYPQWEAPIVLPKADAG
ncbi:MAG TPA: alpha/beta hydrolase-fold protein [Opitutaceae bacterium]|jgi:enterochelin esterase-like enzyme/sugar lactone lactonase YvrE|nr:alpha/beta hydrolase-fold protein [Opitutaceae bacterium]